MKTILRGPTKSKISFNLGWNRIFKNQYPVGGIYLLPSENEGVIIQYDSNFMISCLIPPKERSIEIEWRRKYRRRDISCPTLLMSHLLYKNTKISRSKFACLVGRDALCYCETCVAVFDTLSHHPACYCTWCNIPGVKAHRTVQLYYLYALDPSVKGDIIAQPYRLTNVYEDAKICFRKEHSSSKLPNNLRQANSSFWMNRFDNDFNWDVPHTCYTREHLLMYCKKKKQKHICSRISRYGKEHEHTHTCLDYGSPVSINRDIVCKCCIGACKCFLQCNCCMKTCDCAIKWPATCKCQCCKNICNCPCACDLTDHFADMIKNYSPDDDKWEPHTEAICGSQFFASPKKSHGVFISFDLDFMTEIPKKLWRYSNRYSCSMLIGIAHQKKQGSWTIDLGEIDFSLTPNQVCLIN